MCADVAGHTGCEVISELGEDSGCWVHTENDIHKGNGLGGDNYACWLSV